MVDKVEGADAAAVTRMVQQHCPQSEAASNKAGSIAPPAAISNGTALHSAAAPGGQSLEQKVKQLINAQPVMLFMKAGSPIHLYKAMWTCIDSEAFWRTLIWTLHAFLVFQLLVELWICFCSE